MDDLLRTGLQLHQSGRAEEAASHYERVLAFEPKHPAANHLLGLVFLGRGDVGRAVDSIARAVAARPDDAQYLCNFGVALNAAARHEEAVGALLRAVRINPKFAEAYSNLGMAYRELRRFDEAADAYRRAIAIRPNEAGFHYNLANALRTGGDIIAARRAYDEALRLRPDYPAAANGVAGLLDDRGAFAEALQVVDAALRVRPHEAQLLLRRGRLLQHLGLLSEAIDSYDAAIVQKPDFGEAHHHRANVRRHQRGDGSIGAMEALFNGGSASMDDRIFAGFGLGKALTDIGDHESAVEVFLAVNQLHRSRTPFSLDRAKSDLQTDLARVPPQLEGTVNASKEDASGPIFVVGLPRSGKSTIEAILARHHRVAATGELPTLGRLYAKLERRHAGRSAISREAFQDLGRAYLAEATTFAAEGRMVIDTMPSNYRLVGVIRAAFPGARIVWCRREPAEHCVALFEKYLVGRGYEYAFDLDDLLPFHYAYRQAMERQAVQLPDIVRMVDVANFRQQRAAKVRELLEFCRLSWDDACLQEVETEPQIPAWDHARATANRADHLAAWRKARPDLFAYEDVHG